MAAPMALLADISSRAIALLVPSCILYISFLLLRAIYNVYLHPLASFPGPKAAAASQLPYVRANLRGKLPHWIASIHATYASPVVRISPHELSFVSAQAWKDIYSHRTGHVPFNKDLTVYGDPPGKVHSILTAPPNDHSRMRRVLDHAFSDRALKEQEQIVAGYIEKLIKRLHEQIEGPTHGKVDLVKWYNWMSFDVIGDLSFGEPFDCLDRERYHPWVETIFGNLKGITMMGAFNRFAILQRLLPLLIPQRIKEMVAEHQAATDSKISRRLDMGTDRPDFMSPVLRNNNEEKGLRSDEFTPNTSLFIVAGSESIATNLSGVTWYLLQNPLCMEKVTKEVESAFNSESEINSQTVTRLSYMLACLTETHRIYPTALTGQAMRVPSGGDTISGYWVPGNTGVTINQYAAYRSPTNFTNPDKFAPERWLDDPKYVSDDRAVFQPFSVGPRNCIGKNLGNLETRLGLARMLWNFKIELYEETLTNWTDQEVYLSWQKNPLIVKLSPKHKASIT